MFKKRDDKFIAIMQNQTSLINHIKKMRSTRDWAAVATVINVVLFALIAISSRTTLIGSFINLFFLLVFMIVYYVTDLEIKILLWLTEKESSTHKKIDVSDSEKNSN